MQVHGARRVREHPSFQALHKCTAVLEFSAAIFLMYRSYQNYQDETRSPLPSAAIGAMAFVDGLRNLVEGFFPRR